MGYVLVFGAVSIVVPTMCLTLLGQGRMCAVCPVKWSYQLTDYDCIAVASDSEARQGDLRAADPLSRLAVRERTRETSRADIERLPAAFT